MKFEPGTLHAVKTNCGPLSNEIEREKVHMLFSFHRQLVEDDVMIKLRWVRISCNRSR